MMKLFLALFLLSNAVLAEVVSPSDTGEGIYRIKSDHIYLKPSFFVYSDKLLLTIGGTGSTVYEFKNVHDWGVESGYHVLGLDYANGVISTLCQTSQVSHCYNDYREEIVTGRSLSPIVNVNFNNSILNRVQKLLHYLRAKYPLGSWGNFLDASGNPRWDKITIAGHSQGAGHVAYMAKLHPFKKVIMVGGPHDVQQGIPASWLYQSGKTDPSRFYSLLHWKDFFGFEIQVKTSRILMSDEVSELVHFHDKLPERFDGKIFISDYPFKDPHNSLTFLIFKDVWKTLLE